MYACIVLTDLSSDDMSSSNERRLAVLLKVFRDLRNTHEDQET